MPIKNSQENSPNGNFKTKFSVYDLQKSTVSNSRFLKTPNKEISKYVANSMNLKNRIKSPSKLKRKIKTYQFKNKLFNKIQFQENEG